MTSKPWTPRSPPTRRAPTASALRRSQTTMRPRPQRARNPMPHDRATRAFDFTPQSINEQDRTVELVASTGAGVQRRDMEGEFAEVLSLAAGAVDLSRADGMPLLDSHRQDELERV